MFVTHTYVMFSSHHQESHCLSTQFGAFCAPPTVHHTICCPLAFYISYVCHLYLCYVFIMSLRVSPLINMIWSLLCFLHIRQYVMFFTTLYCMLCFFSSLLHCIYVMNVTFNKTYHIAVSLSLSFMAVLNTF